MTPFVLIDRPRPAYGMCEYSRDTPGEYCEQLNDCGRRVEDVFLEEEENTNSCGRRGNDLISLNIVKNPGIWAVSSVECCHLVTNTD